MISINHVYEMEQAILRSEIARLHGVIDEAEEGGAQKDDTINRLKVKNARLNAVVAVKHVCARCSVKVRGEGNLLHMRS